MARMDRKIAPITIERMGGILRDVSWIGIQSDWLKTRMMPVKFLINHLFEKGTEYLAVRIATTPTGETRLCSGLTLHWQHVYNENNKCIVVEFTINGRDINEVAYESFVKKARDYLKHLNEVSSRTF